jgi:CPA1 family monovalent cation:H+ antiporter
MPAVIILLLAIALLAALIEPWVKRTPIPFTAVLVILGFVGSEIWTGLGFDTGLRWDSFRDIILHLLVPILVFESAYHLPTKLLFKNALPVFVLAVPALLISASISGYLLFLGIGYPQAFPLLTAILAGVILAATDPVAVVSMFKAIGASPRLTALVEGESLFNDATAVVCFSLIIVALGNNNLMLTWQGASWEFIITVGGGLLIGLISGYVFSLLYCLITSNNGRAIISLLAMAIPFYIAEHNFHVSGIIAVLISGLWLGEVRRQRIAYSQHEEGFSSHLWELNGYIANVIVFVLMGVTITLEMFRDQWAAMLLGIAAASISRAVVIYGFTPVVNTLPRQEKIPLSYQNVIMWGGLRGGVGIALALSIPTSVPGWYTVQAIIYGMVLFTLFVQAPLMPRLIKKTI